MTHDETRKLAAALMDGSLEELHGFLDHESLQLIGTELAKPHTELLSLVVGFVLALHDSAGGHGVPASTLELLLNPSAVVELALAANNNLAASCRRHA